MAHTPREEITTMDEYVENGKAAMRGNINTLGIETAAGLWADELAGPFAPEDHARIRGAFLAAYEAGRLHQLTISGPSVIEEI